MIHEADVPLQMLARGPPLPKPIEPACCVPEMPLAKDSVAPAGLRLVTVHWAWAAEVSDIAADAMRIAGRRTEVRVDAGEGNKRDMRAEERIMGKLL